MKKLEFPFVRDGFTHEVLKREGLICLVKRSKPLHWHHEVINLQIEPAKTLFCNDVAEHERYPSPQEWGTHGFTYHSTQLERATEQYHCLQKGGLEAQLGSLIPARMPIVEK